MKPGRRKHSHKTISIKILPRICLTEEPTFPQLLQITSPLRAGGNGRGASMRSSGQMVASGSQSTDFGVV